MIFKFVLVCALVGSPAFGLAVKGYAQREEATKGASRPILAPVEQQRLVVEQQREIKGAQKLEQIPEQKVEEFQQQQQQQQQDLKTEELQQQREEFQQQELKGSSRYEAKAQLSRDELAKGQQREELAKGQQREELAKGQREELSKQKVEQQKELQQQQEKFEQQQRTNDYDSQIELKEEQRRLEESPSVQPILPLTVVEETRSQIQQQLLDSGVKGSAASFAQAPLAEAEPYAFSYQVEGSSRSESGDTKGVVRGQYTLQGADGMSRVVDYVADHNGFRASVNTNEFGTEAKSPANIALRSSQPNAEDITLKLEGKTKEEENLRSSQQTTKTSSKLDQNWSAKGLLPVPQAAPLAKGQRLVQPQQQEEFFQQQEPIKSAELQQPKSLKAVAQPRSSFESATAHRNYRQPAYLIRPAPAAPAAPARGPLPVAPQPTRPLVPAISRSYLQRVRYPPSPVQSGLRSHYEPVVQPVGNPRVSFYAEPPSDISESSSSSFESPEIDS